VVCCAPTLVEYDALPVTYRALTLQFCDLGNLAAAVRKGRLGGQGPPASQLGSTRSVTAPQAPTPRTMSQLAGAGVSTVPGVGTSTIPVPGAAEIMPAVLARGHLQTKSSTDQLLSTAGLSSSKYASAFGYSVMGSELGSQPSSYQPSHANKMSASAGEPSGDAASRTAEQSDLTLTQGAHSNFHGSVASRWAGGSDLTSGGISGRTTDTAYPHTAGTLLTTHGTTITTGQLPKLNSTDTNVVAGTLRPHTESSEEASRGGTNATLSSDATGSSRAGTGSIPPGPVLNAVPPTPQALASVAAAAAAAASTGGPGVPGMHAPIQAALVANQSNGAASSAAGTFASHPQLGSRTHR
jgi:hypothetical protein